MLIFLAVESVEFLEAFGFEDSVGWSNHVFEIFSQYYVLFVVAQYFLIVAVILLVLPLINSEPLDSVPDVFVVHVVLLPGDFDAVDVGQGVGVDHCARRSSVALMRVRCTSHNEVFVVL